MSKCRGCGAEVKWIKTTAGKSMIVDLPVRQIVEPKMGEVLILENGVTQKNPAVGMSGYTPHWATCPAEKQFRKGESPK
jgi:hypothetical protein